MAEILLFHHACGLTAGVTAFADRLRAAGHTVHAPDLYGGRTFATAEEGVAFARQAGDDVLQGRANAAAESLPAQIVYGGMSMGCGVAAEVMLRRPGAQAAFFLYGAVDPAWWEAAWPTGVPAQAHETEDDPWREVEADEGFLSRVPDGELFVYDGAGHLFAEEGHPDYDAETAALATERILELLTAL